MIGFDNWYTVERVFGHEFCFSNAEIMNVIANGLRGEHYIKCNYAIARIQNIKPLVWDNNVHYYVVPE